MKKHLVISALGKDRPGLVNELSKVILENGCNVEDSRMSVLGGEFALVLLISGSWSAVGKMESQVRSLEKKLGMTIVAKQTDPRAVKDGMVPYIVDVVSMDHSGIVHEVAEFFSRREINIEDLSTWTYAAAHTGTPMFALSMTVSVPVTLQIGRLRQEFTEFCDELNLDATLEPARR
jgi:glycine cleavage system transcriptional repressor